MGNSRFWSAVSVCNGRTPALESPRLLVVNGESGTGFKGTRVVGLPPPIGLTVTVLGAGKVGAVGAGGTVAAIVAAVVCNCCSC